MSSENKDDAFSITLPLGAAIGAIALGAAGMAAYLMFNDNEGASPGAGLASSGRGMLRRFGLLGLVTLIENDATRKVLVAVLKAMARRA